MKYRTRCSLHLLNTNGISPTRREKGSVYTIPLLAGSAQESGAEGDGGTLPQRELLQSFKGGQAWTDTTNSSVYRGRSLSQAHDTLWCVTFKVGEADGRPYDSLLIENILFQGRYSEEGQGE